MTRHGGGSFGGGGGGGGFSFGSHGRSSGGSFGPPSHSHHRPPPPHFRPQPFVPVTYYPTPVYYTSGPVVDTGYQTPPPAVLTRYDRRTKALNQIKAIFIFIFISLIIGTLWLGYGLYSSSVIQLGLHDSRLITARPFAVHSIKFKNRGEMDGPLFHEFSHKPALNKAKRWVDSQNVTFHYGHREFYYWMNKGSIVRIYYWLDIPEKIESVFFTILQDNPEDLAAYWDRPDQGSSIRLLEHGQFTYEAGSNADYVFSLVTYNRKNAKVYLDIHFNTLNYDTEEAFQHVNLRTSYEMELSLFGGRYGVLEGPSTNKMGVDTWEIKLSYGTRWTAVFLIYGLVTLVYLVTRSMILQSFQVLDPSLPEHAPLVLPAEAPQNAQPEEPSAPILPPSIPEEDTATLKEKEVSDDQLCSVCLDAPKDSFFIPCGHRATCHSCGLRISNSDNANCPICRQEITQVKKIYEA